MADMDRIKRLVHKCCRDVHSIADVAALANMRPETLRKEFSRRVGISLSRFITYAKVERAKKMLKQGDDSCMKICFAAGFSREEVGYRAFKRVTGVTMQQYRRGLIVPVKSPARVTR